MARYKQAIGVVGDPTLQATFNSNVLVVGAGGIGCELLKNLVCAGVGKITIIDLDTIDTSNLNRQFLFQKRHVKRPKAIVARESVTAFNPAVSLTALHNDIKSPTFNVAFFASFDLVLNALDNLDARRHVNRMCLAADVALIESGTAGYRGQVQPIRKSQAECYDCQPKPVTKSFPVCTIRSTPSTPIHCIVWAKSYVFPHLFGSSEDSNDSDLNEIEGQSDKIEELRNLRAETTAMKALRDHMSSPNGWELAFSKLYHDDITRLLSMQDMWRNRKPPTPLSLANIRLEPSATEKLPANTEAGTLVDQRTPTVAYSVDLFRTSFQALATRCMSQGSALEWDKDDDDCLDFTTAAANLRSAAFHIALTSRFQVKEMAGNIIPAIATTNSAVSALMLFQTINLLTSKGNITPTTTRPWYDKGPDRIVLAASIERPNPSCGVCQVVYATAAIKSTTTLSEFVDAISSRALFESPITLQDGERLIFDPDFDDNLEKSFSELSLTPGKMITLTDEDETYVPVVVTLEDSGTDNISINALPSSLPIRVKPKVEATANQDVTVGDEKVPDTRKRVGGEVAESSRPAKKARSDVTGDCVVITDDEGSDDIISL